MTEEARIDRNRSRMRDLNPVFRHRLSTVIALLQRDGYRPRIQDAWRSPEAQMEAFNSGHSLLTFGFHNTTTPDGLPDALAADVLDDDHPVDASRAFILALARYARANGLQTGIDWGLPASIRAALNHAIENGETWEGKLGWDCLHCEFAGLTVQQAKAGIRPATDERLA